MLEFRGLYNSLFVTFSGIFIKGKRKNARLNIVVIDIFSEGKWEYKK